MYLATLPTSFVPPCLKIPPLASTSFIGTLLPLFSSHVTTPLHWQSPELQALLRVVQRSSIYMSWGRNPVGAAIQHGSRLAPPHPHPNPDPRCEVILSGMGQGANHAAWLSLYLLTLPSQRILAKASPYLASTSVWLLTNIGGSCLIFLSTPTLALEVSVSP